MRVLIVEDAAIDQIVIAKQLEAWSCECVTVDSAEFALDELEDGSEFTLLLVDWNLPGMSGVELVKKVRKLSGGSSLKVVMLTGENDSGHINEAIAAGVDEYLMKPITPETFREKMALVGFASREEQNMGEDS